ncbi:hypothetical protein [Streptomyces sindenensis]|uniref:hypothetical protein n=1 Tax=Streptomyces sindenensis TaxID=67363 RepID=UPI0016736F8E|nr:hypothetical protein [Streptomyces sindenensis]
MTTTPNHGDRNENLSASPYVDRTIEELLAEIEHELRLRRRDARARRRQLRRQQPLRVRAGRAAGMTLAAIGAIAFVAAGVLLLLGGLSVALQLVGLAAAAWGGAAAMVIFTTT